ncbi:MAG: hypothetical protein KJP23_08275 [Deltaproteobacteria bacterium]|nr:hypothetical protein [Deltaproteobacteria bacterium]
MISRFTKTCSILIFLILYMNASWVLATVETSVQKTLKTDAVPIDVTVSPDGRSTFVLTDEGSVLVYDQLGNQTDNINVGNHVDKIEMGPSGERLFATSRQNKTVEIILLSFIRNINTGGSQFKGDANAPVIITVFSEFQ